MRNKLAVKIDIYNCNKGKESMQNIFRKYFRELAALICAFKLRFR